MKKYIIILTLFVLMLLPIRVFALENDSESQSKFKISISTELNTTDVDMSSYHFDDSTSRLSESISKISEYLKNSKIANNSLFKDCDIENKLGKDIPVTSSFDISSLVTETNSAKFNFDANISKDSYNKPVIDYDIKGEILSTITNDKNLYQNANLDLNNDQLGLENTFNRVTTSLAGFTFQVDSNNNNKFNILTGYSDSNSHVLFIEDIDTTLNYGYSNSHRIANLITYQDKLNRRTIYSGEDNLFLNCIDNYRTILNYK